MTEQGQPRTDWDERPIEPLQDPRDAPAISHAEELRQRWRSMMGSDGFGKHSLWVMWFDDIGRQLPLVMPIDDIESGFPSDWMENFVMIVNTAVEFGAASVAFALSRPGPAAIGADDRELAGQLIRGTNRARQSGELVLEVWPLHLATANSVRAISADDLV
jgi:hypothetical protein